MLANTQSPGHYQCPVRNQLLLGSRDVQKGRLVGEELASILKLNNDLHLRLQSLYVQYTNAMNLLAPLLTWLNMDSAKRDFLVETIGLVYF